MSDPRIANLAKVIVDYSVGIKPGDQVFLTATPAATPLIQEMYKLIMQRGGHLTPIISLPGMNPIFYEYANDDQLSYVPPVLKQVIETFDVRLAISSETNTRELANADPAKQARSAQARRSLSQTFMDRSASGELRWNVTLFPTDALAQDADMSLAEFEDFVYGACLCDQPDPVAAWQEVARKQQILVDWLAGQAGGSPGRSRHRPDRRHRRAQLRQLLRRQEHARRRGLHRPGGDQGQRPRLLQLPRHLPGPRGAAASGCGSRMASWSKCSAAKNEEFLTQMLNTDEGARRLGEFAFGTNFGIQRFIKNILFDEKIGGTVHMALGGGYPETGSTNRSAIHWDMICDLRDGGEVTVDGELFAKDGKYVLWE